MWHPPALTSSGLTALVSGRELRDLDHLKVRAPFTGDVLTGVVFLRFELAIQRGGTRDFPAGIRLIEGNAEGEFFGAQKSHGEEKGGQTGGDTGEHGQSAFARAFIVIIRDYGGLERSAGDAAGGLLWLKADGWTRAWSSLSWGTWGGHGPHLRGGGERFSQGRR